MAVTTSGDAFTRLAGWHLPVRRDVLMCPRMPAGCPRVRASAPRGSVHRGVVPMVAAAALLALASPAPALTEPANGTAIVGELVSDADLVANMPRLSRMIDDPRVAIETRIALLDELERRRLIFGPSRWVRLLRKTVGRDLLVVLRAVAAHPSAGVTAALARLLEGPDMEAAAGAALSLGSVGNQDAIEPLARGLGRNDPRLSAAAIRSLARIGTLSARRALELAAAFHPDFETRRHAGAAVIALARRHGTTLAPALVAPEVALATASGNREPTSTQGERD